MKKIISIFFVALSLVACASQTLKESKKDYQQQNYNEALTKLQPLADKGNPNAQYAIGYMYYYGQGVPMDKAKGIVWIQKAGDQGFMPALKAEQMIRKQAELNPLTK